METELPLKTIAKQLLEAGFRVLFWQDEKYNRNWNRGDYTDIIYAKGNSSHIGSIHLGNYGMGFDYSRLYVPEKGIGSSCCIYELEKIDLRHAEETITARLWTRPKKEWDSLDEYMNKSLTGSLFKEITLDTITF